MCECVCGVSVSLTQKEVRGMLWMRSRWWTSSLNHLKERGKKNFKVSCLLHKRESITIWMHDWTVRVQVCVLPSSLQAFSSSSGSSSSPPSTCITHSWLEVIIIKVRFFFFVCILTAVCTDWEDINSVLTQTAESLRPNIPLTARERMGRETRGTCRQTAPAWWGGWRRS